MIYFIIAFALWAGGKIFFRFPKELENNPVPVIGISLIVTFACCLPACFFIDNNEKEEAKKVTLTVTNRTEHDHIIYLRFSDGYTQTAIIPGHGAGRKDRAWFIVQKGDKVQKLIYPDGECEYTPVFDEPPIQE
ncbi:MAG: hypothetical protein J6C85_05545 [Alphaproteobacteria bacterium]|nr:hypothetical protein [Alphaproteobacteria bacterium]